MKSKIFYKIKTTHGFTLIELMVVIVILGILVSFIAPRLMGRPDEAKQVKARIQMESLETAIKLYKLDNGIYPATEQGLQALVEQPQTGTLPKKGAILKKEKFRKIHGETNLYTFPRELTKIMTLFHTARTACPEARSLIRILTAGK